MVGRGEHHVARTHLVGQYHRLQHVDHLCDVGHLHAVGMAVEHVERQGCHEGIAQGVLLIQVPRDGAGLLVPPGAPFVHQQVYLVLRVGLIHDGLVLLDDFLYLQTLGQCPVVLLVVELGGRTLRPRPAGAGVVVERQAVHQLTHALHQHLRPVVVVVGGSGGYLVEAVAVVVAAVGGVAAVEVAIVLGPHVATTAPRLVAHAQILDLPGLFASVLLA